MSASAPARVASSIHSTMRSRFSTSMTGPTSVSASIGSPTFSACDGGDEEVAEAVERPVLHVDPLDRDARLPGVGEARSAASFCAAVSRSASASTITGVELPSSRATSLRGWRWRMPQPTGGLPVKEIIGTSGWLTIALPTVPPPPTTTDSAPSGRPASRSVRASSSAESGVEEAGFRTTGHPAAMAGASLWHTRLSGKLKGEIAPTTPRGSRTMTPSLPAPAELASIGTTSPASDRASTAEKVSVLTQRAVSARACFRGLPASRQIVRAKVSARSATSRAARSRIAARSAAGAGGRCSRASATAALTSSGPPTATVAIVSPVYGLLTARSSLRWSKVPPRRSPVGWVGSSAGLWIAIAWSPVRRSPLRFEDTVAGTLRAGVKPAGETRCRRRS